MSDTSCQQSEAVSAPRPKDTNADPITGQPGAHPVGSGLGAVGMGAAGVAIGIVGGPIGAAVGALIGAVAGGLAGSEVAEHLHPTDPKAEEVYWRENYQQRPYVHPGEEYDLYQPAFQYGVQSRLQLGDVPFEEVEPQLKRQWDGMLLKNELDWERARGAARDAWARAGSSRPTDYNRELG